MRILFVASEGLPFSKTGGLAEVIQGLPRALVAQGHEVAIVLPAYRGTQTSTVVLPSVTIALGTQLRFPGVSDGTVLEGVRYFFVDDPAYFDREGIYGTAIGDYSDNVERYSEFCRVALEIAKHVWPADVIHCHDWQSALVPVLLRTVYADDPMLKNIPVVFTIHNMGYQGIFPKAAMETAGIPAGTFHMGGLEFFGQVNLLKGALVYSDYLTTVSRKYAEEIKTAEFGGGLEGVIRARADRLTGIMNGVDYAKWNPEADKFLAMRYSARDLSGKQVCRQALLERFGLRPAQPAQAVVGIVSRFADQKGIDLIADVAHELLRENLVLVAQGTGDRKYEEFFRSLAASYPDRVGLRIAYEEAGAHQIEAGSDIFLMPSRYEPCGLNQIYSLKYGTVPVVRATGGLDDTIEPVDLTRGTGTGFKFSEYSGAALLQCMRRALQCFADGPLWKRIQLNGMAKHYSWRGPAAEYAALYDKARGAREAHTTAEGAAARRA